MQNRRPEVAFPNIVDAAPRKQHGSKAIGSVPAWERRSDPVVWVAWWAGHGRMRELQFEAFDIFLRLCAAGLLGAVIGFERRVHHKAIGIAGMMLISIGSTTYMLLASHLAKIDPASVSRTLQGFLSGIGFLGGAVIFKSGFDVKGIKAAAAIWITGALGIAIATSYWPLGLVAGAMTALIMFVADSFPDEVREAKQEPDVVVETAIKAAKAPLSGEPAP